MNRKSLFYSLIVLALCSIALIAAKPAGITGLSSLWVGDQTATADVTPGVNDVYINGTLEVDGATRLDGAVTLSSTVTGGLVTVAAKTADYSVVVADSGKTFTNTGATGQVQFDLPASPTAGLNYKFACADTNGYTVVVRPGSTETMLALSTSQGLSVITVTKGACLAVEAVAYSGAVMGWLPVSDRTGWATP